MIPAPSASVRTPPTTHMCQRQTVHNPHTLRINRQTYLCPGWEGGDAAPANDPATRLDARALQLLADAGISPAEWTRRYAAGPVWLGDVCGCPDDRCIGYHHAEADDCGCLPALLSSAVVQLPAEPPPAPVADRDYLPNVIRRSEMLAAVEALLPGIDPREIVAVRITPRDAVVERATGGWTCSNPWHDSAPARRDMRCPDCAPAIHTAKIPIR